MNLSVRVVVQHRDFGKSAFRFTQTLPQLTQQHHLLTTITSHQKMLIDIIGGLDFCVPVAEHRNSFLFNINMTRVQIRVTKGAISSALVAKSCLPGLRSQLFIMRAVSKALGYTYAACSILGLYSPYLFANKLTSSKPQSFWLTILAPECSDSLM